MVVGGKDVEEGEFSLEEQMRRERARLMATGVTSYMLSKADGAGEDNNVGLIPHGGGLWIWHGENNNDQPPRLLIDSTNEGLPNGSSTILDAQISADGTTVAFVADKEVYVMSAAAAAVDGDEEDANNNNQGKPIQVTSGARDTPGMTNGVADYLANEELDRPEGYWLSPNGELLVYESVDESHIPDYRIVHQASPTGLAASLMVGGTKDAVSQEDMVESTTVPYETHRFCFSGTVNPKVKLGIQKTSFSSGNDNDEGETVWLDVESIFGPDFYLAKVEWLKDNSAIVVQLLDRRQKNLAVVLYDATTGVKTNIHLEKVTHPKSWINLNDCFRVLEYTTEEGRLRFLWASEEDGYRHLYVREANLAESARDEYDSTLVHRVTGPGEFIVDSVAELDVDNNVVYYMGTTPGKWLGKRLFRAKLEGDDEPTCLTPEKGQHNCKLNVKAGVFVDAVDTVDYPTKVTLRKLDASAESILDIHDASQADTRVAQFNLKPPTFHTFPSTDQKVTLQAAVYLPDSELHGPGPYPLVVATYGGPHVQYVMNTWGMMTADMRTQFLRNQGFAVIKVDNRGSNRRGLEFETAISENMGELEVADQAAGVQYAIEQGWADGNRVAVSGWSYGGYMALKCLTESPDVFHAAVSGAPVTDWTLYDSAYTERYMGLPQENVEGYQKSSALHKVKDITGSLMLCHGLMDENVLFRQTAVLINNLIEHQKAYEMAMFPSERHGPRRPQDRAFLEERILAFLQRSLNL